MILLIDNYDSFTYNLYQMIGMIHDDIRVVRNDKITLDAIEKMHPSCIIFSPGPGRPHEAGMMEEIIQTFYRRIPMLGICLGHQAIGEVFHASICEAKEKMHGEVSTIECIAPSPIFEGLSKHLRVGRYHSLILQNPGEEIIVTAVSDTGEIMAIQHKQYPVYGVQFHPESILTPYGHCIIENFIKRRTRTC